MSMNKTKAVDDSIELLKPLQNKCMMYYYCKDSSLSLSLSLFFSLIITKNLTQSSVNLIAYFRLFM